MSTSKNSYMTDEPLAIVRANYDNRTANFDTWKGEQRVASLCETHLDDHARAALMALTQEGDTAKPTEFELAEAEATKAEAAIAQIPEPPSNQLFPVRSCELMPICGGHDTVIFDRCRVDLIHKKLASAERLLRQKDGLYELQILAVRWVYRPSKGLPVAFVQLREYLLRDRVTDALYLVAKDNGSVVRRFSSHVRENAEKTVLYVNATIATTAQADGRKRVIWSAPT